MMKAHGVFTLERDIKTLFERFDKDRDGNVTYKDFSNEIMTVRQTD